MCRALDASSGPHLLLRLFALLCAIHRLPISAASALLSTGREDREALRVKEYCEALGLLRCHFFLFRSCLGFRGRGNLFKVRFPFFLIVLCVECVLGLGLPCSRLFFWPPPSSSLCIAFVSASPHCCPEREKIAKRSSGALSSSSDPVCVFEAETVFKVVCANWIGLFEPAWYIGKEMVNCVTIMWCSGLAMVRCGD